MSKKVLITGSSGGFGQLAVHSLLKNGHTVVASMRGVNGKNKDIAAQLQEAGAHIVEIDVTDDKSVNDGVQKAIELAGGLDVVINNAGVGVSGMQEHFTIEDWKKVFEINVFGVQRVNRAALPFLRAQKDGLLIFVSSLLGRMALPFYGPYNSTKWALEAMAENYRVELSQFGIESCVVEPGGFPTTFFGNLIFPSDVSQVDSYGEFMKVPQAMGDAFGKALENTPAQNPQLVADAILSLVEQEKGTRPFRTTVDKMGMGAPLVGYNEQLEQITQAIYANFGIDHLLKVK